MKRKIIAISLILALAVSFVACGNAPSSDDKGDDSSSKQAESSGGKQQPLKLKVTNVDFGDKPEGKLLQNAWLKKCGELLGREININYEWVHIGDYSEKQKIILAGGDIPDIMTTFGMANADIIKFGDQKRFEELSQYMDIMPNYKAIIDADPLAQTSCFSNEGKLYSFYNARYTPDGDKFITNTAVIRSDILEKNNLQIPVTLDEWYNTAKALRSIYPNIYPIQQFTGYLNIFDAVAAANHTSNSIYYNGKEYVYGPMEDSYKITVEYMHKLYAESLISPDYLAFTEEQGKASLANGEAVLFINDYFKHPGNWEMTYSEQKWIASPVTNGTDEAWFFNKGLESEWFLNASHGRVISTKAADKEDVIRFMDLQYHPEIIELLTWGIEGETFSVDANGEKVFNDTYIKDKKKLAEIGHPYSSSSRAGIFPEPQDIAMYGSVESPQNILYKGKIVRSAPYKFAVENFNVAEAVPGSTIPSPVFTVDEQEVMANVQTAIDTFAREARAKFINGERPIDQWEQYIIELGKMGDIKKVLEIYNSKLK